MRFGPDPNYREPEPEWQIPPIESGPRKPFFTTIKKGKPMTATQCPTCQNDPGWKLRAAGTECPDCKGSGYINQTPSDAELVALYRDIFSEITAKATPLEFDPSDPERITAYRVPCGPIHRAAGRLGYQMFGGEQYLAMAVEKIAELKAAT
jgi:hypothetical protein